MKGATLEKKKETENKSELQKRNRYLPLTSLREEMNRLFDDFFTGERFLPMQWQTDWSALESEIQAVVDIKDNDDEIVVTAELPGVKLEDIDITVNTDYLSISGEKREEKEEKEKGKYRYERSFGSFMRRLPLPCEVEKDKVDATYKDGVLKIVLPKTKAAIKYERKVEVHKG